MKTLIWFLLAGLVIGTLAVSTAQARLICVSVIDTEECHPTDGSEPPAWCGTLNHGFAGQGIRIETKWGEYLIWLPQISKHEGDLDRIE